jgi:hypothetical protein
MKTTDGSKIKKGNTYFIVKPFEIIETKCEEVHYSKLYGKYVCYFQNRYESFSQFDLRGMIYKSKEKAIERLKKILKNNIKSHEKFIKESKEKLESINV